MQFWCRRSSRRRLSNAQTGFLTAVPYLFGTVAMILWAAALGLPSANRELVGLPLLLTAVALRYLRLHE